MLHCPPNALNQLLDRVREWRDSKESLTNMIKAGEQIDISSALNRFNNAEHNLRDWSVKWQT